MSAATIVLQAPLSGESEALLHAERLRIARELHDVVAYSFATISIQAGVAAHVAGERPDKVAEALSAIKGISGQALSEMRAILGMLRRVAVDEPGPGGHCLARLGDLAATTTDAGLDTRVAVTGDSRELPPAIEQAAYRIVREALTNVLRHARAATAQVSIAYERDRLLLEIVDDGLGAMAGTDDRPPGSGHGIAGMRERALAFGGELDAGPRAAGGFRVRASLPLGGAS
jgi:signal transduction histidine kinase